jgi:hypothetical protein
VRKGSAGSALPAFPVGLLEATPPESEAQPPGEFECLWVRPSLAALCGGKAAGGGSCRPFAKRELSRDVSCVSFPRLTLFGFASHYSDGCFAARWPSLYLHTMTGSTLVRLNRAVVEFTTGRHRTRQTHDPRKTIVFFPSFYRRNRRPDG